MKIPVKQNDSRPSFHAWGPAGGARHQRRDSGRIGHPSPMDTRKSAVKREESGGEKRSLGCFFPSASAGNGTKNDQGTLLIASFLFLKPSCFNFTGHYLFPYLGSMSLTYWYRLLWIWDLVELFWVRGPFCSLGKAGFAILFGCADLLSFGFYFIIGFSCILRLKNVLPLFGFTRL